ncbi:hypothetical protein [Methanobacterium congolense]|uniref:hypothetical protein n=1 Tax=Methanobacterium congolense TaxID=118062 RepID=UPI001E5FF413|nr:hypothetical protein [Methanobacterium congolense]
MQYVKVVFPVEVTGICSICGRAGKMYTCSLCGAIVCGNCYDMERGICKPCRGRGKFPTKEDITKEKRL